MRAAGSQTPRLTVPHIDDFLTRSISDSTLQSRSLSGTVLPVAPSMQGHERGLHTQRRVGADDGVSLGACIP